MLAGRQRTGAAPGLRSEARPEAALKPAQPDEVRIGRKIGKEVLRLLRARIEEEVGSQNAISGPGPVDPKKVATISLANLPNAL
jgi:hypothetical protein